MRIGLLAPPWLPVPPPSYGGTEDVIDRLARGIVAAGHDVLLFATGDSTCPVPRAHLLDRAAPELMNDPGVELRHVEAGYAALAGCDVIHDHTVAGPQWAIEHGIGRVVMTCHGPFEGPLKDTYDTIARHLPVIGISQDQVSRAEAPVARVIHHGLDLEDYPAGPGDGGYLAFLGRMTPDKGVAEAAALARAAGVPLRIAAKMREPSEEAYFDEHVAPLLDDDVEYLGELDGAATRHLLGAAAALLNPIQWPEPFGLVMIESLACGTPVIARPVGAAPEIVEPGRTGFLCVDDDDFVRAIRRVGELDRSECRRSVEERFSTARMVADHLALYREVLSQESDEATGPPAAAASP